MLRIPTHLTAKACKSARQRGKSDPVDALNVARAVLQEGLESFPAAQLDGPELDLRLLVDHRERLVRRRVELNSTLLWHLHDLWPELQLPGGALFSKKWSARIGRRLARAEQTMRVRIARDELRRLRELTLPINRLEREITELVTQIAPQLLAEPGFGPLTAAKLVGEIAGAQRFATSAKLARAAGVAPIPASSGTPGANGSIRAATARSTRRCTASSSPAPAATSRRATTSPVAAAKARAPARPSAASSDTSSATSGDCSQPPLPTRTPPSPRSEFLDIEATCCREIRPSGALAVDDRQ